MIKYRIRFLLILIISLIISTLVSMPIVHAQEADPVCNPVCGIEEICVYEGFFGSQTACIPREEDSTVEEVVVTAGSSSSLKSIVARISSIVDYAIVPLLYALAFILFLIGVVRYFFLGGDEGREKGKAFMVWGLIGLVVIFSVWGIVNLLLGTLGFTGASGV